jgi:hypothetical protein
MKPITHGGQAARSKAFASSGRSSASRIRSIDADGRRLCPLQIVPQRETMPRSHLEEGGACGSGQA